MAKKDKVLDSLNGSGVQESTVQQNYFNFTQKQEEISVSFSVFGAYNSELFFNMQIGHCSINGTDLKSIKKRAREIANLPFEEQCKIIDFQDKVTVPVPVRLEGNFESESFTIKENLETFHNVNTKTPSQETEEQDKKKVGRPKKNEGYIPLHVFVPQELVSSLDEIAIANGLYRKDIIIMALQKAVSDYGEIKKRNLFDQI